MLLMKMLTVNEYGNTLFETCKVLRMLYKAFPHTMRMMIKMVLLRKRCLQGNLYIPANPLPDDFQLDLLLCLPNGHRPPTGHCPPSSSDLATHQMSDCYRGS